MMKLETVCLSVTMKVEWKFGILHALLMFSFWDRTGSVWSSRKSAQHMLIVLHRHSFIPPAPV